MGGWEEAEIQLSLIQLESNLRDCGVQFPIGYRLGREGAKCMITYRNLIPICLTRFHLQALSDVLLDSHNSPIRRQCSDEETRLCDLVRMLKLPFWFSTPYCNTCNWLSSLSSCVLLNKIFSESWVFEGWLLDIWKGDMALTWSDTLCFWLR